MNSPFLLAAEPSPEALPPSPREPAEKIYTAGTGSLHYTLRGLAFLFLWLLWGDFAFTFFESVFGRFIPLYLKDLHAPNSLIGIMTGSLAGVVNILFLPNISQWSDRTRSRWGRRIPFLYVVAPLTALSLVAVGFAPELAEALRSRLLVHLSPSVAVGAVILPLLCLFVVSFHFFNMVLVNAYNWLLRDVVPEELMARFLSWFRIVGTVSSCAFLWLVFPHLLAHRHAVFLGVGAFYLASFLLMCRNIKEGPYPPPPVHAQRPGLLQSFALYFRECLSVPLYRHFFLVYVLTTSAITCASPFSILFSRESLGMTMDDIGMTFAWGSAACALAYLPIGWLCDRFSPLPVALVALAGQIVSSLLAYFLVHDKGHFLAYTMLSAIPAVGWALAVQAASMKLFPEERFGQFSSALSVFACGAFIPGNYLMGFLMDLVHSDYRIAFLWSAALFAFAIPPLILVYRGWRRHGGPHHYRPPLPPFTP